MEEKLSAVELADTARAKNQQKREERNEELEVHKLRRRRLGGLRTMPFILANEVCDRFASGGFHANMISYLTQELNLPLVKASNTLTNFGGTSSFTPLIGALIADSFAGRFWTIVVGSIFYELGLVSITISAILPSLQPPACPTKINCQEASASQLWALYAALLLTSIGAGGIRPCILAFAADQFESTNSITATQNGFNFFNVYYFCMGMAGLTAITVVVYIQDNVGWGIGLGIPTIAMGLSLVIFLLGGPLYKKLRPGGSPLTRLAQVVVAAVKKRKISLPDDSSKLYVNKELDATISVHGRLLHTDQFGWLDKAAVVTREEEQVQKPNLWRLATVHRVEELKSIIRMLPIWVAGIFFVTSLSHQYSFTIQQARSMDRHLSPSFQIPPASMSIFSILTMLIGLVLYDRLFVPFARRFTKNPAGITCLQRMGVGYAINILATLVSSFVEIKRRETAIRHGLIDKPAATVPFSVFWLVPQYCIHGIAEVFMSVGHIEFLYDQSPESLRSTAVALYWVATSAGNYLGTLIVTLVHEYTGKERNWLPDRNLNRGRLERYYWLVTGLQVVNLVYYVVCAHFYNYKPLEVVKEELYEEEASDKDGRQAELQMKNAA
uniref:Uncharacterized protein n=1 Tax=Kalanchoe fedtschenkoi TaxID=63787 RepID=A0A7N0TA59_KALFE